MLRRWVTIIICLKNVLLLAGYVIVISRQNRTCFDRSRYAKYIVPTFNEQVNIDNTVNEQQKLREELSATLTSSARSDRIRVGCRQHHAGCYAVPISAYSLLAKCKHAISARQGRPQSLRGPDRGRWSLARRWAGRPSGTQHWLQTTQQKNNHGSDSENERH